MGTLTSVFREEVMKNWRACHQWGVLRGRVNLCSSSGGHPKLRVEQHIKRLALGLSAMNALILGALLVGLAFSALAARTRAA